ncbi:MAG: hypothetical protein Q7T26_11690 [Dehalococcoidia bacterium]|nr:hypothetical protein [Dehalococcoidia bacterium]
MGASADDCAEMLRELASVDGVTFVLPRKDGFRLDLNAVARVVLMEEEDARAPVSYSLRFQDASGHDLMRADFPNPYLDDEGRPITFNPHRLAAFEDFCRRYAGADGVEVRRLDRAYPARGRGPAPEDAQG